MKLRHFQRSTLITLKRAVCEFSARLKPTLGTYCTTIRFGKCKQLWSRKQHSWRHWRQRGCEGQFKVRSTITERMNSGVSLGVVTWSRGGMEGWLQDAHYVFMYSVRICYLEDKLYFIINDHSEPRTYNHLINVQTVLIRKHVWVYFHFLKKFVSHEHASLIFNTNTCPASLRK